MLRFFDFAKNAEIHGKCKFWKPRSVFGPYLETRLSLKIVSYRSVSNFYENSETLSLESPAHT